MDFHNSIASLQKSLYKGFENAAESDIKWLNGLSGEFLKFFRDLHKFMVFDCSGEKNTSVLEEIFLCIHQITVCIRNLERVLGVEKREGIVLTHFLDRILWCLARVRSSVASITDNVALPEEANFVVFLDAALDLLEPLATFEEDTDNVAERNAEAHVRSKEIRCVVDSLISQTLAFVNVALEKDKTALTAHCQRVLKECIALEEECVADPDTDLNRRFRAELLEVALTHLEQAINSSLLRLVCTVFVELSGNPVERVREGKTDQFDLLLDRILQIGILGIAFSSDQVSKSILRSCLASSECLDSALIPSILSDSGHHSRLLENHFREEMTTFQREIQKIIDTDAICMSIVDTLSTLLEDSSQAGDPKCLEAALQQVKILRAHLEVNKVDENPIQVKNLADFHKMLTECEAALELREAEHIEPGRITKRFRILLSVLKRLHKALNNDVFEFDEAKPKDSEEKSAKITESADFFHSLGINPHVSVILYKTKAPKTDSMVAQFSKLSLLPAKGTSSRHPRRNLSLRRAMFKSMAKVADSTLNLNVTHILEGLTTLSDTFTEDEEEIQEIDHKIRIKVKN